MNLTLLKLSSEVTIRETQDRIHESVLNMDVVRFLKSLHTRFNPGRLALLEQRAQYQLDLDPNTEQIRNSEWTVAPVPTAIQDRRVEITGPTERKMMINALNSGARVFMADCEDSLSPTWENVIQGQINLRDAVFGNLNFTSHTGKHYAVNRDPAVLFVRPRGLHMLEKHIEVEGVPMSASLVDFGIFFYHNAQELARKGLGPFFYLPKIEHAREALWWNRVFQFAQDYLNISHGTVKATVLVETITATFQLDEILFHLRDHSAGFNCGRWDYIFSYIKKTLLEETEYALPDRSSVGMETPFLNQYAKRVIQVAHKRGAHAMGGMSAFIPIKADPEANQNAIEKVRQDKVREATLGHDGTWVAHPGLVKVAYDVFDAYMPDSNQLTKIPSEEISTASLLERPTGKVTTKGIQENLSVGIQYTAAWLSGFGAAAINHLMEDAATAEISRTQLWQWLHVGAVLEDGTKLSSDLLQTMAAVILEELSNTINPLWKEQLQPAFELFLTTVFAEEYAEFLTLEAYDQL